MFPNIYPVYEKKQCHYFNLMFLNMSFFCSLLLLPLKPWRMVTLMRSLIFGLKFWGGGNAIPVFLNSAGKGSLLDISGKDCRDVPWNVSTGVSCHAYLIFTRCLLVSKLYKVAAKS